MTARDGVKIRYRYFPGSRQDLGTIVLLDGRTEFMEKYAELLFDFKDAGYGIFIYDHRGQGRSDRLISDPIRSYVKNYADYVSDLKQLMDEVVRPAVPGKIYFLSASMGGAIATEYLIENPGVVSAQVAISPMYAPNLLNVPQQVALRLFEAASLFTGRSYVANQVSNPLLTKFAGNWVTTSENRFTYAHQLLLSDNSLVIGNPTNQWTLECIRLGYLIRSHAEKLLTPTLIFQAEDERIVLPSAQAEVADKAFDTKVIVVPGARHEIFMENESARSATLQTALEFLKAH